MSAAKTPHRVSGLSQPAGCAVPKRHEIHLILDNYGTHTHPKVNAWFAAHPRYHRHFVPTSASWLNLIECWFAEITRKRIRRASPRSSANEWPALSSRRMGQPRMDEVVGLR